jgi:hypothetical protein
MPHLNVEISEEAMRHARREAARAGMLLRKWVERTLLAAGEPPRNGTAGAHVSREKGEVHYEPLEE